MYQIQKDGPFSNSLKYLKMMRQIPVSMSKSYLKKFYTIFLLLKTMTFVVTAVGPILFIIASTLGHSEINITEAISIMFGASGGAIVTLLFVLKYREWSIFFKDLADTSQFGKPATYQQTVNFLNRFITICIAGFALGAVAYAIAALYGANCEPVEGFNLICPTYIPIWLPFGANSITVGLIVFVLQFFFLGILSSQPFLTMSFIMYESTEILICHIDHLNDSFKKAFEAPTQLEIKNRLRICVNYHIHILKLGFRLSSLIKFSAGHISLLAALVCGSVGNQILNTKPMGSLVFLAAWMFALFCFCHAGQKIKDKTLSIGDALWESQWYKADNRTMKDVQFILFRCQKPICYEAIPLGILDYPFYFMMIKTGYSYFALFNQSL